LPAAGQLFADGLSEPAFLLWAASALYFGTVALRPSGQPGSFALAGFFSGLAYLTRPEGALIAAAVGGMLLAGQFVPDWRRSWCAAGLRGVSLAVAALLLACPFIACTGKLTVKPTGNVILKTGLADSRLSGGPLLAAWDADESKPIGARGWWGVKALSAQLFKASFYLGLPAALAGMWLHRQRFRHEPGAWMMLLVCLGVAYLLWRVASVAGYLSDRHTLLIILCMTPWTAAGLVGLGERLRQDRPRLSPAPLLLPLAFAISGLPKTLETLHYHRAGFREAGLWLAEHSHPLDQIEDPLCWAHFYAGRVFLEHTSQALPPGYQPRSFVVIEEAGNTHPRMPAFQQARAKAAKGEVVYRWTGMRGKKHAEVRICALPPG
jgi:4-amino-4-deoxy-L-arabinose transferase-like glycosyltransferase